jgi:thioredoxin 1
MALGPTVSHIARHFEGKLKVCKLNIDEAPETAEKYLVQNIPTLIVFKGGKEADRMVGVMPKKQLEDALKKHLSC